MRHSNDPVAWLHDKLDWQAFPYEAELLRCQSRFHAIPKPRQVGCTTTLAYEALMRVYVNLPESS